MKRNELVIVTQYLQKFKKISAIERVEDSVIRIVFDHKENLFFDMSKSNSYIFYKDAYKRAKIYNAPFDVILHKRCAASHVEEFTVMDGNRILRLRLEGSSSYKSFVTYLQFEFTGRNTNCIILDEDEKVLEALRHIDSSVSFRSIKVGEKLEPLPQREFQEPPVDIGEDIKAYLELQYTKRMWIKLTALKNQKMLRVQKERNKFYALLQDIECEKDLLAKAATLNAHGSLLLSNLAGVKIYEKYINLKDFSGQEVCISIPNEAKTPSDAANLLFLQSKKLKRKAKSLYIERENLIQKIDYLEKLSRIIEFCEDENELQILMPKKKVARKQHTQEDKYESFFINGYKVMLGKNEKGNIALLKFAKKSDIWMHLKDIPSAHIIIRTDKQNIPNDILAFSAKLCVDFSVSQKGMYLVDYTQRRNVKINDGANVHYINYQTIQIDKEK
ncbi:MAG: DUF814 domain-containing protein [Sulfurospirillum sp.]|nr:DUF814 domain-containing protein [Sulfurospirillum sp.]